LRLPTLTLSIAVEFGSLRRGGARRPGGIGRPEWDSLAPTRGAPVPDGPVYEISVKGRRITRFGHADDEPIAREAVAALTSIWNDID
jgi:hypothetical protein